MTRTRIVAIIAVAALIIAAVVTHGFGLLASHDPELRLYGNVDVRQVDLAFRVPGRIASLYFDEGDKAPAGAVLSRLDARPLTDAVAISTAQIAQADADLAKRLHGNRAQEIEQARAQAAVQKANLDRTSAEYQRKQSLVATGAVSHMQLEAARADFEAAQAQARSAQAALSLQLAGSRAEDIASARATRANALASQARAQTDLADATLVAPEAGTILTRAREPGAIVQAGETVFTLTIDHPVRVRAYVDESSLPRISPGMPVEVHADGAPHTYHGTIGFISPTAEFTPKSVQTESLRTDLVYRIRVIVTDADGALRQGEPVTLSIPQARPAAKTAH